ncbi:hypothetical protein NUBL19415_50110 [Klebsiella pneumoniae]|nr:hypothetical protein NUBL19415_50110 [Klebsiella pneumoniae]
MLNVSFRSTERQTPVKTDLSTPLHVRIQDPLNNEKGALLQS